MAHIDKAPEPFEIIALKYAHLGNRHPGESFILADPHEFGSDLDYFVWVLRRSDCTYLVDCGFAQEAATRRKRNLLRNPADALPLIGMDASQVTDIILTHLHYDHAGNLQLFPRARFHLQESEMAFATGRHMAHAFFAHAYDLEAVLSMVRLVYGAQVQFHHGDAEIVPGITVHHVGGHTHGLQVVRVWTRLGWVVLASDAAHYLANMTTGRPFPIVADVMQMAAGWERLHELASRPQYIIPGHDPLVMQRYREPEPSLRGVAVRLDAEPQGGLDGTVQR